jgi:hypothetical protein
VKNRSLKLVAALSGVCLFSSAANASWTESWSSFSSPFEFASRYDDPNRPKNGNDIAACLDYAQESADQFVHVLQVLLADALDLPVNINQSAKRNSTFSSCIYQR